MHSDSAPFARVLRDAPNPSTVVVTVTYGDRAHLVREVVQRVIAEGVEQVVVVDNGSPDENARALRDLADDAAVTLIRLAENCGSAEGYAEGLAYVREHMTSGMVWLLDDDNVPEVGALAALRVAAAVHGARAAFLAVRTDRPEYVRFAQGADARTCFADSTGFLGLSWSGAFAKARLRRNMVDVNTETSVPSDRVVPYAPYGGFMFPASALRETGLPRRDFFLYGDDHEFSLRFPKAGWPIFLVHEARVTDIDRSWHVQSETIGRTLITNWIPGEGEPGQDARLYYTARNRAFLEVHVLPNRPALRVLNAVVALAILLAGAVDVRVRGGSWVGFHQLWLVLRGVRDGQAARLGRTLDVT